MAKKQWKRVLVTLPSGDKAYRYTDGQGNYRMSHPDSYESMNSRRGLSGGSSGPSLREQLSQMAGPAGGETRTARVKGKPTKKESKSTDDSNSKLKIDYSKYDVDSEAPKGPNRIKPAEVKPAPTPVRASEQRTTTTSSSTRQSAPAKRDTRNDEYNRLRIKANKSGSAEDRKAAESEGMKAWRKANPKLAEALDRRNAAKNKETSKPETTASKRGSTSPTSGSKPVEGGSFNDRGMFDRKKRKKSGGGGSYA